MASTDSSSFTLFLATLADGEETYTRNFAFRLICTSDNMGMLGLLAAGILRQYREVTRNGPCKGACDRACIERRIYAADILGQLIQGERIKPALPADADRQQEIRFRLELGFAFWCLAEIQRGHLKHDWNSRYTCERGFEALKKIPTDERPPDYELVHQALLSTYEELRHNGSTNWDLYERNLRQMLHAEHPIVMARILFLADHLVQRSALGRASELLNWELPGHVVPSPWEEREHKRLLRSLELLKR